MRDHVLFYLNGRPVQVGQREAFHTLSRYLRYELQATGTKIVCEEGDCGACTVLIGRPADGAMRYRPVNSCIQFLFQLDGTHVVTVEGLSRKGLTPVQEAMVRCHGAQCGYCTPGFIMAMAAIYEDRAQCRSAKEAQAALTGNLCRCTGYEPIIKAALEVQGQPRIDEIFPPQEMLPELSTRASEGVRMGPFLKAESVAAAAEFKGAHPGCVIVQGGTDVGVWCTKRSFRPPAVLTLDAVPGLDTLTVEGGELVVGGRVTLAALEGFVRDWVPQLTPILDRFGSPQIRNAGTLAGNIANASPIADTLPFLFVCGASLELTGRNAARTVSILSFYRGYKTLDLAADEIITRIRIPLPSADEVLRLYKVSKRSHLDISSFTAAMLMRRDGERIGSMRVAYGGVGPVVLRLAKTESFLAGKRFERETFRLAGQMARDEIAPISDVRGSRDFRLQLAANVMEKFYFDLA